MTYLQNLFTSRDNNADGATYVGQTGRIWWDPVTNAFYYSDGNTAGGIPIGTASGTGIPIGPVNSVQINAGGGNFAGSSNLVFSDNVLNVVGNASATGNISANYFLGNGSQLTGVITALGNAFATVNANGTSLVADNSSDTVAFASGNNLVITGNAGTDTMTIAVADAPVFSGNVTTKDSILANTIVNNGTGNVYVTGNLLPTDNIYSLGLPTIPWFDAYFGPQSITILDATGNIGNAVVIENIAANIVIGTTGFTINEFGTTTPIFRIEALTGQIFSAANTIIQNATQATNTTSGSLQTAGGAGIAKDLYVGGNIYGTGRQLSNVVNSLTAAAGISVSSSTGAITVGSTGVLGVAGTTNQINVSNVGNVLTLSLPQNLNTTANVQLYSLTVTDLIVLGNVSNVTPSVVDGKIVYVANTATNQLGINTSGLVTGNAANGFYAGILYDTSSNTWVMDIGNSVGITSDTIYTTEITANGQINLGNAYNDYDFSGALIQGDTSVDSFSQYVIKNHSQTANASSDFVAVSNNGDDSVNYIDLGINSNVYANVDYAVTGFNDGYLFTNGGNLVIGTQTSAKVINFFTGGTDNLNKIRVTISDTGLSAVGNITANNMISTNATIGGTVTATGNITGGNLIGNNLTAGRVAIVGANKQVSDSGAFTFSQGAANVLTVTGNVNATNFNGTFFGNIVTTGNVSTVANIIGAYGVFSGGNTIINAGVSTTGNVTGGNLITTGIVSATGNITGNYYIGNGSQLTGVITSLGNAFTTISSNGTSITATTSTSTATLTPGNNITITGNATTKITVFSVVDAPVFTGNVSGNYILGNGSALTGVVTLGFTTVSANGTSLVADSTTDTLTLTPGNNFIITGNATTDTATFAVSQSPTFTGNVSASYYIGNGSQLTGITGVITTITPTALSSTVHVAAVTTGNTANIITDATTANTANTIVVRDANGAINVNGWTVGTHLTAVNYTATSSDFWIGTTAKNKNITLPNGANGAVDGRQYQIADTVHSGVPGTTIVVQSGDVFKGNQPSQQGQLVICTYLNGTWYCN